MKYLTQPKLKELSEVVTFFKNMSVAELSYTVEVYDDYGEVMGWVQLTDNGDYGFVIERDEDE